MDLISAPALIVGTKKGQTGLYAGVDLDATKIFHGVGGSGLVGCALLHSVYL